jgi:hypothetical protein
MSVHGHLSTTRTPLAAQPAVSPRETVRPVRQGRARRGPATRPRDARSGPARGRKKPSSRSHGPRKPSSRQANERLMVMCCWASAWRMLERTLSVPVRRQIMGVLVSVVAVTMGRLSGAGRCALTGRIRAHSASRLAVVTATRAPGLELDPVVPGDQVEFPPPGQRGPQVRQEVVGMTGHRPPHKGLRT